MLILFVILIILSAILLTLVVLAQNSKGGMGATFGGSGASQMMGVKKTSDILEKMTWGLIVAIMVLSLGVNVFFADGQRLRDYNAKQGNQTEQIETGTPEDAAPADNN